MWDTTQADVLRAGLESAEADVAAIRYLVHFPERPVSQLPNHLPDFLWVHVSVHMLVLLLLFIGPQLEYLPKIEERHLLFQFISDANYRAVDAMSSVISATKRL